MPRIAAVQSECVLIYGLLTPYVILSLEYEVVCLTINSKNTAKVVRNCLIKLYRRTTRGSCFLRKNNVVFKEIVFRGDIIFRYLFVVVQIHMLTSVAVTAGYLFVVRTVAVCPILWFSVKCTTLPPKLSTLNFSPKTSQIQKKDVWKIKKVFSRFCRHTVTSPECQSVTCDRSISFLSHSCHAFIYLVTAM